MFLLQIGKNKKTSDRISLFLDFLEIFLLLLIFRSLVIATLSTLIRLRISANKTPLVSIVEHTKILVFPYLLRAVEIENTFCPMTLVFA